MNAVISAIRRKLTERRGASDLVASVFVVLAVATLLCGAVVIFGQASRIDNLQQMAQLMAREIALKGILNTEVSGQLADLEELFKMDVEMDVDGEFIGGGDKLKLESPFTVTLSYRTKYGVGGMIHWGKEEIYRAKASGIVEEYHKSG